MDKTSTINSIIKYLYGELTPASSVLWTEKIMSDSDLTEEFEALAEVKHFIEDGALLSPSDKAIKNIMAEVLA